MKNITLGLALALSTLAAAPLASAQSRPAVREVRQQQRINAGTAALSALAFGALIAAHRCEAQAAARWRASRAARVHTSGYRDGCHGPRDE